MGGALTISAAVRHRHACDRANSPSQPNTKHRTVWRATSYEKSSKRKEVVKNPKNEGTSQGAIQHTHKKKRSAQAADRITIRNRSSLAFGFIEQNIEKTFEISSHQ
eukprot:gene7253-5100_t